MNEPQEQSPARDTVPEASNDARMAEILSGDRKSISQARRRLKDTSDGASQDLLDRLDALDYVDSLVGQPGSELPERLGEYRITDLLGRGGMGTVFEAFQESLERPVALKVLAPSMTTDEKMRRRFRAEARASATLHHQHIVPVYGFGETAGYLYFTMERVDGVSLDKHISTKRATSQLPEPREVARRFAGVADALAHAHKRGILHRDVKPGNILVHPYGELALADFGLSKMLGEVSMSMSAAGGFLGTLHYAAPEQAKGRDASPSSDFYSLGVTLYESLTNELPLEGKTTEAMLDAILNSEPSRLRHRRPRAPKDLDAVIHKLLQKEPEDRYTDGEELARDLLRVADDEPVRIRRLSAFVRAWRLIRKHPSMSAAVVVVLALLVVVFSQWRTNADAKRVRLISDHEQELQAAATCVDLEAGDSCGPAGLFVALTGVEMQPELPSAEFLQHVRAAQRLRPEDERAAQIRAAYSEDPDAYATELLAKGHGFVALKRLNQTIGKLERQPRDTVTSMQKYRLYVERAVANLTSAVGDATAAGKDLLRASMIRPGAFFPQVLAALLDWREREGVEILVSRLDAILARDEVSDRGARVVGALLIAFARIDAPPGANLMQFPFEYGVRRRLHMHGVELWGGARAYADTLRALASFGRGLESQLYEHAVQAREMLSAPSERSRFTQMGRDLLRSQVAPGSALQSWAVVYDLIDDKPLNLAFDRDSLASQIDGVADYLNVWPNSASIRTRQAEIGEWLAAIPDRSIGVARLRALFAESVLSVGAALDAAHKWVHADPEDPAAYLCRMRCRFHEGRDPVASDASVALQKSIHRRDMRADIIEALRRAEQSNAQIKDLWRDFDIGS